MEIRFLKMLFLLVAFTLPRYLFLIFGVSDSIGWALTFALGLAIFGHDKIIGRGFWSGMLAPVICLTALMVVSINIATLLPAETDAISAIVSLAAIACLGFLFVRLLRGQKTTLSSS